MENEEDDKDDEKLVDGEEAYKDAGSILIALPVPPLPPRPSRCYWSWRP